MLRRGLPCHDRVLRPGALPGLGASNGRGRTTLNHVFLGCAGDSATRTRQSSLALCLDRDLCVATWFPGMLGSFGREKGFLYRERELFALCGERNFVSREGLGLGQGAWVAIRVFLCHDRVFPRVGHSFRDRVSKGGVAI